MKKVKVLLSVLVMFFAATFSEKVNAQITPEHSYYIYHGDFYITDIGTNDYKYIIFDSTGFSMYNLDHTQYFHHVTPPIPLWQLPAAYEVSYITKSLFDCDTNNIEYAVTSAFHPSNFYVFRTDSTLLFERDSVTGPTCPGCFDGSVYIKPIVNTPEGTKLFLQDNNREVIDSMYVYSLCGTLPAEATEEIKNVKYVQVFPNPTNGIVNFKIFETNKYQKLKLTIYDLLFQKVDETTVNGNLYQMDSRQKNLSGGTYLFELKSENKILQTGKFLITR